MRQVIGAAALLGGVLLGPQGQAAAPDMRPGPFEAHLTTLYGARQYDALTMEIAGAQGNEAQVRVVNWLLAQESSGGMSTFITIMDASRLWVLSAKLPPEQQNRLKEQAAGQYLLTKWLMQTEGFQCADPESVENRSALFFASAQAREIQAFIEQLPQERATQVRGISLGLMLLSFSRRKNDDWLCRAGPHYFNTYVRQHPGVLDTSNPDAKVVVPDDPSIEAEFVPFSEWKEKRIGAYKALDAELGLPPTPAVLLQGNGQFK